MAILKTKYEVKNKAGQYDVVHFETNQDSVVILDQNKNTLGTLNELMFSGKVLSAVNYKTIKVSGIYSVRNLTGLPVGITTDRNHILVVRAIGPINAPTVINYQLIEQGGSIYNKTVVGASESPWSNGGTNLQNTINGLLNDFGNKSNLNTANKSSVVNAVNEVNTKVNELTNSLNNTTNDYGSFKSHNHDTRYLRTDAKSILKTAIDVEANGGLNIKFSNGSVDNMLKATSVGGIDLGNATSQLNIRGSRDLLHNGQKVWTEVNDGAGSGLDADKLDGYESSSFALKSTANTFSQRQTFSNGATLTNSDITWGSGRVNFGPSSIGVTHGGKNLFSLGSNGNQVFPSADMIANYSGGSESRLNFKLTSAEKGIGFTRSNNNNHLRLFNYNMGTSGAEVFRVQSANNVVEFTKEIQVSGRKLFLQNATPTGTIPDGSIWIY